MRNLIRAAHWSMTTPHFTTADHEFSAEFRKYNRTLTEVTGINAFSALFNGIVSTELILETNSFFYEEPKT